VLSVGYHVQRRLVLGANLILNSLAKNKYSVYNKKKKIVGETALNKAVKVRRLSAARLHKTVFGLCPLHGFVPPHFCGCWNCFAIPLSRTKKRLLSPNVTGHKLSRNA